METLAIDPDGEVVNGHQRLAVLRQQHGEGYEVDVRVASRKLTVDERKKLTIYLHEGATGEWDFDGLGNLFDVDELKEWGFPEWKLNLQPNGDEWGDAFAKLPQEDRAPFQQMTFTLHDEQAEQVKAAVKQAKAMGAFDTLNENSNGNALARICETFITYYGQG